jgi:hypothetical protein
VGEVKWWTPDEIAASDEVFAPRRLSVLLAGILVHGPPDEPLVLGV